MMQVVVQRGQWYYRVTAERGIAIRGRCSFSELAKISKGPFYGALIDINQRVQVGESLFLGLKDGGWLFDVKNGKTLLDGPVEVQMLPPFSTGLVRAEACGKEGGMHLASSPTKQRWAVTKFFLLQNSKVQATMTCYVEGRQWMYVRKGDGSSGGVEGWAPYDTILLEVVGNIVSNPVDQKQAPDALRANSTAQGYEAPQPPELMRLGPGPDSVQEFRKPLPTQAQYSPQFPSHSSGTPVVVAKEVCSCGARFFDNTEDFCRTCGARRVRQAVQAQGPLCAAHQAGFTPDGQTPMQNFGFSAPASDIVASEALRWTKESTLAERREKPPHLQTPTAGWGKLDDF